MKIMTNDTWYTGPGILLSRMAGYYSSLMMICHTPIEDGSVRAWHGLMVEPPNFPMNEDDKQAVPAFQEGSKLALLQDFEVWANKAPCLQVMQVVGDGPFNKARAWYKQFYNPRKDIKKHQEKSNGHWVTKGTKRDPWAEAAE